MCAGAIPAVEDCWLLWSSNIDWPKLVLVKLSLLSFFCSLDGFRRIFDLRNSIDLLLTRGRSIWSITSSLPDDKSLSTLFARCLASFQQSEERIFSKHFYGSIIEGEGNLESTFVVSNIQMIRSEWAFYFWMGHLNKVKWNIR